ncbi:MAG: biotin/lipoyl-binding protein, partial [Bryobacteraceae bacterium]
SAIVQVKSQVAGQLMRVHFTEGQNVSRGAPLFSLDARPFEEALRQAEASVARDRALLKQAESLLARDQAQSKYADADADRYSELAKAGVIAKAQEEQVRTSASVTRQSVQASQAAIESARAALESDLSAVQKAKLDIAYSEIKAPISGRAGNLLVNAGNLVKANDVPWSFSTRSRRSSLPSAFPSSTSAQSAVSARGGSCQCISLQDDPERSVTSYVS